MKNNKSSLLFIILFVAYLGLSEKSAMAAGFDCSKASSTVENMVCSEPMLSQQDDRLTIAYHRAVINYPQIKQQQLVWLQDVRNRCADVECLKAAYHMQISSLNSWADPASRNTGVTPQRNVGVIAVPAPQSQATAIPDPFPSQPKTGSIPPSAQLQKDVGENPLGILMNINYFVGQSELSRNSIWSDPRGELYGKNTLKWTDQDFQLFEQKLREQIEIERNVALKRIADTRQLGYTAKALDDDYAFNNANVLLEKIIASIPKYKYLASQARAKETAARAEQEAQEKQRLERESALEQQRIADAEFRSLNIQKSQEEDARSRNLLIFLAIVAAAAYGWYWNKFIRLRCPTCRSTDVNTQEIEELDRWRGTKKVSERNSRGTNTRHVSTTYVKNQYHYQCQDCQKIWMQVKKQEL